MRRGLLRAVLVILTGVSASVALVHAQAVHRSIYASALDQNGAPVQALAPADVVVKEDKVTREVLTIEPATDPMQIALLIDNSQSAEQYIRDLREAASTFVNTITADPSGAKHQIAIITLGERPTINTEYTTDKAQLLKGANRIFSTRGSGEYLLDGIIETSQGIKKRESTRPVIVAITTDGPDLSDRVYQSVLEPLKASGAAFHAIVLGRAMNDSHDRAIVLDVGTKDTGGRYDIVLTGTALPNKMKQVATELTHQFKVTYARPQTLIPPEQVTISSAKQGVTVRGMVARGETKDARQ